LGQRCLDASSINIEKKMKMKNREFQKSKYTFNPIKNGYQTDWKSAKEIWTLPDYLIKGTTRIKPIVLG
jgi:hypothetical protein